MREDHKEQVERWANFARENPVKAKAAVKKLVDSQLQMSKKFYNRLERTAEGRETIKELKKYKKSRQ